MDKVDSKICPVCQRPKVDKLLAVLNEASVEVGHCKCSSIETIDYAEIESEILMVDTCRLCRKRVKEGRKGSFTQWIFRHDLCSCDNPQIVKVLAQEAPQPAQRQLPDLSKDSEEEVEIEVKESGFPIDAFKPLERIGAGGVGQIYRCRNRKLKVLCAVKTLRMLTPEHLVQLQQEARIISKLDNENILKVLDFGLVNDQYPFMVTEYVRGNTLRELLENHGALHHVLATEIFIQVCNGLQHAHSKGIFHRDVSSGNVIVNTEADPPIVKLIDFGLSMSTALLRQVTTRQGLTIVGTAAYMSPDQLAGQAYDARSEIYSVGCLMFEVLTGRPPFAGDTPIDVLAQQAEKNVPTFDIVAQDKSIPTELELIVRKCLEKNKDKRYQSIEELKLAIEGTRAVADRELVSIDPLRSAPKKGLTNAPVITAIAGGALICVLVGAHSLAQSELAPRVFNNSVAMLELCANVGNQHAMLALGDKYLYGKGVDKDARRALQLYGAAAQSNNAEAHYKLGLYYFQKATPPNPILAQRHFASAASLGHIRSKVLLSLFSVDPISEYSMFGELRLAAEKGDALAKCILAVSHFRSCYRYPKIRFVVDVTTDFWTTKNDDTLKLMREAADGGVVEAQFNLGLIYEKGIGCEVNLSEAKRWYLRAARHGDSDAQYRYAHLLEVGADKQNNKSMLKWYTKSASQLNWDASVAMLRQKWDDSDSRDYFVAEVERLCDRAVLEQGSYSEKTDGGLRLIAKTKLCPPTFVRTDLTRAWKSEGPVDVSDLIQLRTLLSCGPPTAVYLTLNSLDGKTISGLNTLKNVTSLSVKYPSLDSSIADFALLNQLRDVTIDLVVGSTRLREEDVMTLAAIPAVRRIGLSSTLSTKSLNEKVRSRFPSKSVWCYRIIDRDYMF